MRRLFIPCFTNRIHYPKAVKNMFLHPDYEDDYPADENDYEGITSEQVHRILKSMFEKMDAGDFKKLQAQHSTVTHDTFFSQSYKFKLVSPHSLEANLDIIWKGAEMHIRIEYK